MKTKTWREEAAPIISSVIRQYGTSDLQALRRHLRDAYPFGEKKYYPYKVWCDEITRQLCPAHSSTPHTMEELERQGQQRLFD